MSRVHSHSCQSFTPYSITVQYYNRIWFIVIVTSMSHTTNAIAFKEDQRKNTIIRHLRSRRSHYKPPPLCWKRVLSVNWTLAYWELGALDDITCPVVAGAVARTRSTHRLTVYWHVCSHLRWDTGLCCRVGLSRCCSVGAKQFWHFDPGHDSW